MVSNWRKTFPTSQRKKWQIILRQSAAKKSRGAKTAHRPKIVLDSNLWISAILFGGNAESVVLYCLDRATLVVSEKLQDELYGYFRNVAKAPHRWLNSFNNSIEKICEVVSSETADAQTIAIRDQKDTHILAAAMAAQCDYIITGDKDLLVLESYQGIPIVTASQFLDLSKQKPGT